MANWVFETSDSVRDTETGVLVKGVRSEEGLSIEGTVVTVSSKASLSGANVTVSDGYTLALADDVSRSSVTSAERLLYNNGTATYVAPVITSGYVLSEDARTISYNPGSSGEVEIKGVKSAEGITVSDKTITIDSRSLNQQNVRIDDDGYTLAVAGVSASTTTKEGWTLEGTTATYKTEQVTEGYEVSASNEIEYTPASGGETVVTVNGVKATKGLELAKNESVVAVYNTALDPANTVTISEGYTLEFGDQDDESKTSNEWIRVGENMAYRINEVTAGYKLNEEGTQISYVEAAGGSTLAEFSGLQEGFTPTVDNTFENIHFSKENFQNNVVLVSSEVTNFDMAEGSYEDKSFTAGAGTDSINNAGSNFAINGDAGNDRIINTGSDVTISGGTGADNVTMNAASDSDVDGNNIFVYNLGDGNDILYNFDASDKIQILGVSSPDVATVKNKDVIFKVGSGQITVRDAANKGMTIMLVNDSEEDSIISADRYTKDGITRGDIIELATTLKKYTQEYNIGTVDGTKLRDGAQISGNDNGEGGTLLGGAGKDTITTGENNFYIEGGKGNDLFVYGGGNDTIGDYSQSGAGGADKVSLGSFASSLVNYGVDGDDVILAFGENDSLTIIKGKDKEITFADKKATAKIYGDAGVLDIKGKFISLASSTEDTFTATGGDFKKLVTIDGSAVVNQITINGNTKANYIVAGETNTTLNGGKGKDTLVGGEGADVFVYDNKSGNKVIRNYTYAQGQGDTISLGSGAEIAQVTTKKDNVALKIGTNTITIEGMAKSQFTFVEGGETKIYDNGRLVSADGKSVTLASDYRGAFDLNSSDYAQYTNVTGELGKKGVSIVGDSDDNILTGGAGKDTLNGGANNDTLFGGKGNDVLWGGDDADTFIYQAGTGTDTIMDYNFAEGDVLSIIDKRGRTVTNAIKDWSFDGDDLNLSIKGGGKLILAGVGAKATISYNGTQQSF